MNTLRREVLEYVSDNYGTVPDSPWKSAPLHQVLRHRSSKKWYGLIMRLKCRTLGINRDGEIDVINLKCEPLAAEILVKEGRAMPAYHMNKQKWITVLLDGSADMGFISNLIDESYELTK